MRDSFENSRTGFMNKSIYLSSPTMHGLEMKYIQEAFDTNWVAPLGKNVDEFEKEMAAYVDIKHAAALISGTSALHLAIKLCGVKPGDIVICSDLTFSATVNPVSYEGGTQVFVDSEYDTWNMDPRALEIALKKYPQAKAVLVAHLYGTPAKMDEILALCEQYHIPLIEDAAESLGATYKGRQTGTFGKYSALSYNGNKIITTSGGGMFLSNDEAAVKKVRFWATQSRDPAPHYQHSEIGYNYRMSNIVAGIGRGQLVYLNDHIQKKKQIYETYRQAFKGLPISMNPHTADSEPNYWLSCMLIDKEYTKVTYQQIMEALLHENIESRPIWKPMHLQPVFQHNDFITVDKDTDVGGDIFSRGLCLPSDIKITEDEQARVISIIKGFFR
jgi:dTDP-4-amino-4,6-dideoxygalactose transaminase